MPCASASICIGFQTSINPLADQISTQYYANYIILSKSALQVINLLFLTCETAQQSYIRIPFTRRSNIAEYLKFLETFQQSLHSSALQIQKFLHTPQCDGILETICFLSISQCSSDDVTGFTPDTVILFRSLSFVQSPYVPVFLSKHHLATLLSFTPSPSISYLSRFWRVPIHPVVPASYSTEKFHFTLNLTRTQVGEYDLVKNFSVYLSSSPLSNFPFLLQILSTQTLHTLPAQ